MRNLPGLVRARQEVLGFSAALGETTKWGRWLLWSISRGCRPRVTPWRAQRDRLSSTVQGTVAQAE
eukprot:5882974-Pyramimonas_sp.AAC.2